MYKKLSILTVAMVMATGTAAMAANPFSDVAPDNWAYKAVEELAEQGIIKGYPDGTFQGNKPITRYEVAEMIARAMANEANASIEQKALINKLSEQYVGELHQLGVRVASLEDRVGNVKVTGDVRVRYRGSEKKGVMKPGAKSKFDYRARIQFDAKVNDKVNAVARIRTGRAGDPEFGGTSTGTEVAFDRAFLHMKANKFIDVSVGRTGLRIGEGLTYNNEPFDGVVASYRHNWLQVEGAHGYMTSVYASTFPDSRHNNRKLSKITNLTAGENPSLSMMQIRGTIRHGIVVSSYYIWGNKNLDTNIYGVSLTSSLTRKTWVGGEWIKAEKFNKGTAWAAGLGYGLYKPVKANSWDIKLQYFNEKYNAPIFTSRYVQPWAQNYKGWLGTVDYALAKNVGLSAYYGFHSKTQDGVNLGDYYRADVNVLF